MLARIIVLAAMLMGTGAVAATSNPFAAPVANCHPCRFSPGPGQPQFVLKRLEDAWNKATALYKRGDAKTASATMESAIGTIQLALAVSSYPVQGDDPADKKLVGEFNDFGFFLFGAGRFKDAVDVLGAVTDTETDRVPAYLNLADAQYASGDRAGAKTNYAEFRKRMAAAGKAASVPPRVAERLR